jgi:pimeloyl-ACP methyl ester carboxylesterase
MTEYLDTDAGRRLAHDRTPGRGPGVVFLGGFRSDKEGSKALHLESWARQRGRAFLRFDYSGHGQSSGAFEEGCIGDWAEDARAVLAALVGIAAAPDFTDRFLAGLSEAQRNRLMTAGRLEVPSDYAPEPYVFTRRLVEDGAAQRVLDRPLRLNLPVRLLQGTEDSDVPVAAQMAFFDHLQSPDARLTLVKGADHRFSSPDCLDLLTATLDALG